MSENWTARGTFPDVVFALNSAVRNWVWNRDVWLHDEPIGQLQHDDDEALEKGQIHETG